MTQELRAELRRLRRGSGATPAALARCTLVMTALGSNDPAEAVTALRDVVNTLAREDHRALLLTAYGFAGVQLGRGVEMRRGAERDQSSWRRLENQAIELLAYELLKPRAFPAPAAARLEAAGIGAEDDARATGGASYRIHNNITTWIFDDNSSVRIRLVRQLEALQHGVTRIPEFYSGSGHPDIKYDFVAEHGCTVETNHVGPLGHVTASLGLGRALRAGERHTMVYRIERNSDVAPHLRQQLRSVVQCVYGDSEPTERETCILQFPPGFTPDHVWVQDGVSATRVGHDSPEYPRLTLDSRACVQHEFVDLKPNRVYAICWTWPEGRPV